MPEWADEELAALVRRVLPPRRPDWRVQVVDNPDEAGAMFTRNLIRVQRHWREAVYDAGLHSVMMHHPLSLQRMRCGARIGLDIWKARAIRRETRTLIEVRGYLARLVEGQGLAFDKNLRQAEEAARSPAPVGVLTPQARARRDKRRRALLDDLASRTRYDGGFRVAAATYERWFQGPSVTVFRMFKDDGLPLATLVNEARDGLLPELQQHEFQDFMLRLRWDLESAELTELEASPLLAPKPGPVLAPEDDALLAPEDDAAISELGLAS